MNLYISSLPLIKINKTDMKTSTYERICNIRVISLVLLTTTLIFFVLKSANVIKWNWLYVLIPVIVLMLILFFISLVIILVVRE